MDHDNRSWEEVAKKHERLVSSVVRDLGLTGESAKDARQEGLVELRKVSARYDPSRAAFSTFLRRVLVRRLIRWHKDQHHVRVPHSTAEKVDAQRKDPMTLKKATPETCAAVDRTMRMSPVPMGDFDDESQHPDEIASRNDEIEFMRLKLLKVPARARQVLISVHGLFGADAEPIADVAREMEITVARATELLDEAVLELADLMKPRKE